MININGCNTLIKYCELLNSCAAVLFILNEFLSTLQLELLLVTNPSWFPTPPPSPRHQPLETAKINLGLSSILFGSKEMTAPGGSSFISVLAMVGPLLHRHFSNLIYFCLFKCLKCLNTDFKV